MAMGQLLGTAHGQILLDMSALRRAAQDARAPLRGLEQGLEGTGRAAQTTQRQAVDLSGRMDRLKQAINLQQRALQILEKELEQTAGKFGAASVQAQRKQLALDRLLTSIDQNKTKLADLGRQAETTGGQLDRAGGDAGQASSGLGGLEGAAGKVTGALGALGIAIGAAELVSFGKDAIATANDLEKTEAMLRLVAGTTERYDEVLALARENQLLFGGSLNEQLGGMRGVVMMSERYGAGLRDITETFRLLNLTSPEQGIEGATVALKEFLASSDASGANSLAMRFELDKGALKEIIKTTPDATERLRLLREEMAKMGIDSRVLDAQLNTTANTYDQLGVAIGDATAATGRFLADGLEPAARGLTRLLGGGGGLGAARESFRDMGERMEVGVARLFGFQGGWNALGDSIRATLSPQEEAVQLAEESTESEEEAAAAAHERALAQARAAGDIDEALRLMRESAGLTEEDFEKLLKQLEKTASEGAKAFGEVVSGELDFQAERESAAAEHAAELEGIEADYTEKLADLQERRREATTKKQRVAIDEQIADLKQSHADKLAAEEAAFAAAEKTAAEAYARQQAAQLAHLGSMLIEYTRTQAAMAGIAPEQIAQMTTRLADEYGVQTSLVDRSFGEMTRSIDAWAASGGQNTDQVVADMGRIQDATTELQREVDRQISRMTDQAKADFDAGKLDIDQYAERLTKIPAEARIAAQALLGIPTRVESEVVITTTRVEGPPRRGRDEGRGANVPDGRARGGPVLPGGIYQVADDQDRAPEVLLSGGKTYLLMGAQGGTVLPALRGLGGTLGREAIGRAEPGSGEAAAVQAALRESRVLARGGLGRTTPAALSAAPSRVALSMPVSITLSGVVMDTDQRVRAIGREIADNAVRQAEARLGQAVDQLIQGGLR